LFRQSKIKNKNKKLHMVLNSKIPQGPLSEKWTHYKAHQNLVNPANKRKLDVIVVGTGLAGGAAAASQVFF
jgi:succinate dehydrogenase / fumarate reductase, flavoprotein subunit